MSDCLHEKWKTLWTRFLTPLTKSCPTFPCNFFQLDFPFLSQNYNLFTLCSYIFRFFFLHEALSEERVWVWHHGEKWIYTFSISRGGYVRVISWVDDKKKCVTYKSTYVPIPPKLKSEAKWNGFKWIKRKLKESSICW